MVKDVRAQTCCLTGHRTIPANQIGIVKDRLRRALIESIKSGYCFFGVGGALGFDTLAAQEILDLKRVFPEIKLILVLPCKSQTRGWKRVEIEEYERIKSRADKFVYTSESYYPGCMQKRNRHLVDNSSRCICYLTSNAGGTAYTVDYAKKNDCVVINIAEMEN